MNEPVPSLKRIDPTRVLILTPCICIKHFLSLRVNLKLTRQLFLATGSHNIFLGAYLWTFSQFSSILLTKVLFNYVDGRNPRRNKLRGFKNMYVI